MEGRLDEARSLYDRLLDAFPGHPLVLRNRGYLEVGRGRFDLGKQDLEQALSASPDSSSDTAVLMLNLGAVYLHLKQLDLAVQVLERSAKIDPKQAETLSNLGEVYRRLDRFEEAERYFREALQLARADNIDTRKVRGIQFNLALTLEKINKTDEASALFLDAWRHEPHNLKYALSARGQLASRCAWDELEKADSVILGLKTAPERIEDNTIIAHYLSEFEQPDLRKISEAHCGAAYSHCNPAYLDRSGAMPRAVDARLRVGYLLADARNHANGYNTVLLFGKHDRQRFEVFVYSTGPNDHGWVRAQIEREAEHFVDLFGQTDQAIAQRIHDDRIDILVDLMGHTSMTRLGALAYRPAPVQMTWLGYPGTTGASFVDYIIGDPIVTPTDATVGYTESIVRLPHTYQINNLQTYSLKEAPTRSSLGLPEKEFVLCCFNNPNKLNRERFTAWMNILKACPGSVLWLNTVLEETRHNLQQAAARLGIESARLIFSAPKERADYLASMQAADLFLDTSPCGAHTTASDALWAGLPVLTVLGDTFASRVCASLLHAANLPELVMPDESAYIAKAIAWAQDSSELRAIRHRLAETKATLPLFDADSRVRELELAYTQLWQKHRLAENQAHERA